jgi:death-on-curing family protein
MKLKTLSIESVRYVASQMAEEFPDSPSPEFDQRFKGILESCLAQPFQSIKGKELYPSFIDKAAMLFYLLIKNHPFEDGNKRMAVMILNSFLIINGYFLHAKKSELYDLAIKTAESKTRSKDRVLANIRTFLKNNIQKEKI